MEKIATHNGIVTASGEGRVKVKMEVHSACSSCHAHAKCGFSESAHKEVTIDTKDWLNYPEGTNVEVIISQGRGMAAVWWAYLLPAILIIICFAVLYNLSSELITALVTLVVVAVYYVILWFFRQRLQKRFSFRIRKM